jgi:hypothetical protein
MRIWRDAALSLQPSTLLAIMPLLLFFLLFLLLLLLLHLAAWAPAAQVF